jgi:hypothetical protein
MGARRRKKSPKKAQPAAKISVRTATTDRLTETVDSPRSKLWAVLGRDSKRPVPIPLFAAILLPISVFVSARSPGSIVCPQSVQGTSHIVISIVVGVAIGGGITAIAMITSILGVGVKRVDNSIGAVRTAVERAGLGAVYGTLMSTVATLMIAPQGKCGSELLSNISNGATWGTMLGFALSIPILRKQMFSDAKIAGHQHGGFMLESLCRASVLFGSAITLAITASLIKGTMTPS